MKKTHTHKYERVYVGGRKVVFKTVDGRRRKYIEKTGDASEYFKCVLPGCTHRAPIELMPGRLSVCWRCGDELTLDKENLLSKHPIHEMCKRTAPWAEKRESA